MNSRFTVNKKAQFAPRRPRARLMTEIAGERRETARLSGHAFGMELSTHDKQDASVGLLIKRLVNSSRVTEERAVAKGCEDS